MSGLKGNQKRGGSGRFEANPVSKPGRSLKDIPTGDVARIDNTWYQLEPVSGVLCSDCGNRPIGHHEGRTTCDQCFEAAQYKDAQAEEAKTNRWHVDERVALGCQLCNAPRADGGTIHGHRVCVQCAQYQRETQERIEERGDRGRCACGQRDYIGRDGRCQECRIKTAAGAKKIAEVAKQAPSGGPWCSGHDGPLGSDVNCDYCHSILS